MSAYFQTGSMSAGLVMHREMNERIRRAGEHAMVRAANPPAARRIPLLGLLSARRIPLLGLLSARRSSGFDRTRLAPASAQRLTRQAFKG